MEILLTVHAYSTCRKSSGDGWLGLASYGGEGHDRDFGLYIAHYSTTASPRRHRCTPIPQRPKVSVTYDATLQWPFGAICWCGMHMQHADCSPACPIWLSVPMPSNKHSEKVRIAGVTQIPIASPANVEPEPGLDLEIHYPTLPTPWGSTGCTVTRRATWRRLGSLPFFFFSPSNLNTKRND